MVTFEAVANKLPYHMSSKDEGNSPTDYSQAKTNGRKNQKDVGCRFSLLVLVSSAHARLP